MVQQRWRTLICALGARLIWTRFMQNERLEGYNSRRVNNFKSFYGEKKIFSSLFTGDGFLSGGSRAKLQTNKWWRDIFYRGRFWNFKVIMQGIL